MNIAWLGQLRGCVRGCYSLAINNLLGYISPVEKRRPQCDLAIVTSLLARGSVRGTSSALRDAATWGFDFDGMLAVVATLMPSDFHKSMTTHADHRIWQDVYRPSTALERDRF